MANWRHTIALNEAIEKNDEEFDLSRHEEQCPQVAKDRIAEQCEAASPLRHFGPLIRKATSIAEVNRILHRVYDVADQNLVWCGG